MQQLQIIGRLGQDAKVIDHNGKKFLSFTVAVDDDYKDQSTGQKVDRTVWYDCTGDQVNVAQYLKKGTQVFCQGKPRVEQYTSNQDGKVYAKTRLQVNRLQLLGNAPTATTDGLPPAATPSPASAPSRPAQPARRPAPTPPFDDDNSGDLPF